LECKVTKAGKLHARRTTARTTQRRRCKKGNPMHLKQDLSVKGITSRALVAAVLCLVIAGCSSQPPPPAPPPPPVAQGVPPPPAQAPYPQAPPPAPALTADEMAKLCQQAPDTCQRVQTAQPLTVADVKVMARLGFGSDVIINQIRNSHTVFHLTANAIIDLKDSGVTEPVIDFLISTPSSIAGSTPVPEPPPNSFVAQTPPPAPPPEIPPPTPGPDYAWIDGDWVWNGGWVWVGGHWALPPFRGGGWIHGRWTRGFGGFRREPGHWR
jgi:hypothetical protein